MSGGVNVAATICPVPMSTPTWNLSHERRLVEPCFSTSHSPGPLSFSPVPSISRCRTGGLRTDPHGQGSGPSAQGRVIGHRQVQLEQVRHSEPISPSVWRKAK